jgi:hypothetical protein
MTIGEVLAGLKATEARIHNLSCTSDFVTKGYFRDAEGNPPRPGLVEHDAVEARQISAGSWIVESSGKSWCKYSGKITSVRADGSARAEEIQREAAFDGIEGRHVRSRKLEGAPPNTVGLVSDGFVDEGPSPLEFTTHWLRRPVSATIEACGRTIADQETWEERPVVVVETAPLRNRHEYKTQFWVDPSRGFTVVRRRTFVRYADDRPWHPQLDCDSLDHKEVSPGIWLPQRIESKAFSVPAQEPEPLALVVETRGHFSDWRANEEIPDGTFRLRFPTGVPGFSIRYLR